MLRFLLVFISFISIFHAAASPASETPNPAATFCIEQGGSYKIVDGTDGQRAASYRRALDGDGAGTTLSDTAAKLGAGQFDAIAYCPQQGHVRRYIQLVL